MDTVPKIINGQLHFHYTQLFNWDKNEKARAITDANRQKLHDELLLNAVEDAFKIGEDGIVYDGNNRLKMIKQLIEEEGKTHAQLHPERELAWIPVTVKHPTSEAEKWSYALKRNEQFAHWDADGLSSFENEWEDLDVGNINVDFFPEQTIEEQLKALEKKTKASNNTNAGNTSTPSRKMITCPACQHTFIPSKA